MSSQNFVFISFFANSLRFQFPWGLNAASTWTVCYYWLFSENFIAPVAETLQEFSQKIKNFLQKSANVRSPYQLTLRMTLFYIRLVTHDCNIYIYTYIYIYIYYIYIIYYTCVCVCVCVCVFFITSINFFLTFKMHNLVSSSVREWNVPKVWILFLHRYAFFLIWSAAAHSDLLTLIIVCFNSLQTLD